MKIDLTDLDPPTARKVEEIIDDYDAGLGKLFLTLLGMIAAVGLSFWILLTQKTSTLGASSLIVTTLAVLALGLAYLDVELATKLRACRKTLKIIEEALRHDPDVCCCGCNMEYGGDICYHGGCRSQVYYVIDKALEQFHSWKN